MANDDNRVSDWEIGLPTADDLTPLSQHLIPPELASAFSITPEPFRSISDVNRASQNTISTLRSQSNHFNFKSFIDREKDPAQDPDPDQESSRGAKRARLVWTPQLHKRFVEVVTHLGIKNAVPKTIMQMMNVEGLSRENVASHLQKYRLYLKRMQDGPSSSDQLFASSPAPQSLNEVQMNCNPQMMYGSYGYNMMQERDWNGNNYAYHHRITPNET